MDLAEGDARSWKVHGPQPTNGEAVHVQVAHERSGLDWHAARQQAPLWRALLAAHGGGGQALRLQAAQAWPMRLCVQQWHNRL